MAKQEVYNTEITESDRGVSLDTDPSIQRKGTRRFTLNAVEETTDGQQRKVSNELSNYACTSIPTGFYPLGERYTTDDISVVILTNPTTHRDQIGFIGKNNKYIPIVDTGVLGLSIQHQCDVIFRIRKGKERVIYWVDGDNFIRTFNFDRIQNFYSSAYTTYLKAGGDPMTFIGEKWDKNSFNLIKTYDLIPEFGTETILESGNAEAGSYNFTIQLVDEDLNPTSWITTSNTINIYNDSTNNTYGRIRGSRYVQNDAQSFPRTNKAIKLEINNLDQSFPFYRIAIIRAAGSTGNPEKVFLSDLYSTANSNFIYSGNDADLTEGVLEDILIDNEIIFAAKHIEQQDNRLIVANGRGKGVNYCEYQKYASKISSNIIYKEVLLNNIASESNVKNGNSTWKWRGYMPGEVESYGIVFVHTDKTISPVFHIPGKDDGDRDTTESDMAVYKLAENYLDIHNCSTDNYWGVDANGNDLVDTPIRHHRFPFRSDVNKPLVTSTGTTTNITKHRLKITITLNPAYTPSPSYPDDGAMPPIPLVIPYKFTYQVHGAGSTDDFEDSLTIDQIGVEFFIYDDTVDLDTISGLDYALLDLSSPLGVYQDGINDRFVIAQVKEDYVLSSSFNDDVAEIFGIEFSNIERPSDDIIGFYIVRNERLDDDKLIIDNAIFGAMTSFQQYVSFGLINPKQYYHVNNCGREADSGKTVVHYNKGIWFFNPEFEYFGKRTEFDSLHIEGAYNEANVDMPTISNTANSSCNNNGATHGGSKGVYIDDVQAGTSYDPSVNKAKNKDDDGFDLIIGYRNIDVDFDITASSIGSLVPKKKIIYLNAASYQNLDGNTFYNVSVDNKIGMFLSDSTFDTNIFFDTGTKKNSLLYGSLVRDNTTAYSNFMTRPYYKEHNNMVEFTDDIINDFEVFNGDAEISGMSLVSSTFYDMVLADRSKKSGLWKIILGSVLVVAGVLLAIPSIGGSLGLTVAGVTALSSLAISYGVSLAMAGIKFDQFKSMIDTDYELGLKDTVSDGGTFETIREGVDTNDDTIRWFADRASNLYIESSVPFGLRSGLTSGVTDFIDAPAPYDEAGFRSYLTEKLTALDRNQGSGRIYKGYATAEFYDMNLDYLRFNKQKNFIHLPLEYDCCSDPNEDHPLRRWWSQQSFQEEKIDNYRAFLPNNYNDMEGVHGEITDLYMLGNNLFVHTKEALWQQPATIQERVVGEIVSFLGTGEFLSLPPRKVLDDDLGSGGTKHKWATVKTPNGVVFVDEIEHKICLHGQKLETISLLGLRNDFQNTLVANVADQIYAKFNIAFPNDNNPTNPNGVGYIAAYDKRYERVIVTKRDFALVPSALATVNIAVDGVDYDNGTFLYNPITGIFSIVGVGDIDFTYYQYFENKSWTKSFSFSSAIGSWTGWHSYLPSFYIHNQNNLYSFAMNRGFFIWKHNLEGSFGNFYGDNYPFIIEVVLVSNPLLDKTNEDVTWITTARVWNPVLKQFQDERYVTFSSIMAYNSRQNSGLLSISIKETQANPKQWYQQQITNVAGEILASKRGRNWNINDLRDYVIDYEKPMFTQLWDSLKDNYFIDKNLNSGVINFNKTWSELESFRDKYLVVRLIFDTFNNVNLTLDYTLNTEQISDK